MRIRDVDGEGEEPINLMSLIDTLFFLLMFFLVATRFKEEEREVGVQLPAISTSAPLSAAPQQLIINIREDGSTLVGGKVMNEQELGGILKSAAEQGGRDVLIRADERSLHRYFAGVASLCRRMGVQEVKIGYLLEEPQPVKVK